MSKKKNSELLHQKEELDILESIYMDEIELHNPIPPYKFSIQCRPYLDFSLDEALERFAVKLEIELGLNYPQESPKCEIKHHVDKISNSELQIANKIIEKTAQDMKGSPMLFEIVESLRNWLQNNIVDPDLKPKKLKRKNMGDEFGLDDEYENDEIVVNLTKKETYTAVTRESFLEWKARFDAEMENLRKLKGESGPSKDERLSGKQLFERDMKLISSDALYQDENDVEAMDEYEHEEEKEEEEDEESNEKVKQLFCYNEDLFEGDVDIEDDS